MPLNILPLDRGKLPSAFQQVLELGKRNSKTLGFFPLGAFKEHADKGNIFVALDDAGEVEGYVAFRVTGNPRQVRIVHLCVREQARGRGVATALIEHLVRQTQDALGIGLYCRAEYDANLVWPKLDFRPLGSKPGRGADGAELVFWWRDNGHPTLFSQVLDVEYVERGVVRALLDANVVFDLDDPSRPYHEEAVALLSDWLAPLVQFSVSSELDLEVHRQPDAHIRKRSQKRAQSFFKLPTNTDELKRRAQQLREHLSWGNDENSVSDSKHLAYAALHDIRYFITRDEGVLRDARAVEELVDVVVLRPSDFILRFDELQREDQYRPRHLGDTRFRVRRLQEADSSTLYDTFRNHLSGELKKDFQQRLTKRLAQPNLHFNSLHETQHGKPLVLLSSSSLHEREHIEFFRTAQDPLIPFLSRYVLQNVVLEAFVRGKAVVTCDDPELSPQALTAMSDLGFHRSTAFGHLKFAPFLVAGPDDMARGLRGLLLAAPELREEAERLALSVEVAAQNPAEYLAQVERALWPAKILHDELANFVLPIKPSWARKLFDEGVPGLFSDSEHEKLLLNWENVYYSRAARPTRLRPGSRILWYVSSEASHKVSAIRACSTVEEVRVGKARELYQAFKRLGVYRLQDLTEMTRKSGRPLLAIRFARTELFARSIRYTAFQANRAALGLNHNALQGPLRISDEEFRRLYLLGHGG